MLAAPFAFVLAGLVLQANWPKLLRVGVAAVAYPSLVALLARRWWRPAPALVVGAISTVGGALLFGGFHYLALRAARRARAPLDAPVRSLHAQ